MSKVLFLVNRWGLIERVMLGLVMMDLYLFQSVAHFIILLRKYAFKGQCTHVHTPPPLLFGLLSKLNGVGNMSMLRIPEAEVGRRKNAMISTV